MGGFFKAIGKALWKGIRSKAFRELVQGLLLQKLQEQEAKEGAGPQ